MTVRFDRDSLRFVDAVTVPQHENSFVTIDPATMTADSMDHFDGDELTRYDVAHDWKPLPPLKMSRVLHHTQGADVYGDANLDLDRRRLAGHLPGRPADGCGHAGRAMRHPGGEGEGIDAWPAPWASCTCSASTRSSCRCGSSTSAVKRPGADPEARSVRDRRTGLGGPEFEPHEDSSVPRARGSPLARRP